MAGNTDFFASINVPSIVHGCIESLFKTIIEEESLDMSKEKSIKHLWDVIRKHFKIMPIKKDDANDINKIVSGLCSIIDGIAGLRNELGSAHGDNKIRPLKSRHIELVVSSAYTVANFLFDMWQENKKPFMKKDRV